MKVRTIICFLVVSYKDKFVHSHMDYYVIFDYKEDSIL